MADSFGDLFAFVYFGDFGFNELVATLAEVEDVGVRFAPC